MSNTEKLGVPASTAEQIIWDTMRAMRDSGTLSQFNAGDRTAFMVTEATKEYRSVAGVKDDEYANLFAVARHVVNFIENADKRVPEWATMLREYDKIDPEKWAAELRGNIPGHNEFVEQCIIKAREMGYGLPEEKLLNQAAAARQSLEETSVESRPIADRRPPTQRQPS